MISPHSIKMRDVYINRHWVSSEFIDKRNGKVVAYLTPSGAYNFERNEWGNHAIALCLSVTADTKLNEHLRFHKPNNAQALCDFVAKELGLVNQTEGK